MTLTKDQMLARVPNLSYRQLNLWTNNGYLRAEETARLGQGYRVRWLAGEDRTAACLLAFVQLGFGVKWAARLARLVCDEGLREINLGGSVVLTLDPDELARSIGYRTPTNASS